MVRVVPNEAPERLRSAEGEATALALADGLAITPPLDRREPEVAAAPPSVVRSPPALRLPVLGDAPADALDAVLQSGLSKVGRADPNEFAYAVAELTARREDEILRSGDEAAAAGLTVLTEMTRMLQHLFLMRTGRGGH